MDLINDFDAKRRKYMPVFPIAKGKPTVYIEGYPYEDDEPMGVTAIHVQQMMILCDQLMRYYVDEMNIYVGMDNFVYYRKDGVEKCVAPDLFIVFGVSKIPPRRSFYTWAEGASPVAVFEFLSYSTAARDRVEKRDIYLSEMGVQEYYIHQPDPEQPAEFRGWQRTVSGDIRELTPNVQGELFSEALNLRFGWEERVDGIRLLRAYLPDGTPLTTSMEEADLRKLETQRRRNAEATAEEAKATAEEAKATAELETQRRRNAEATAEEAKATAEEAKATAELETQRRRNAEATAELETQRRQELEVELEKFRAQLNNR